jgi:hypothetical protein
MAKGVQVRENAAIKKYYLMNVEPIAGFPREFIFPPK